MFQHQADLLSLPTELLTEISSYLGLADLLRFSSTCKTLAEVALKAKLKKKTHLKNFLKRIDVSPCELNDLHIDFMDFLEFEEFKEDSFLDQFCDIVSNAQKVHLDFTNSSQLRILEQVLKDLKTNNLCKLEELTMNLEVISEECEIPEKDYTLGSLINISQELMNSAFLRLKKLSIDFSTFRQYADFMSKFLQQMSKEPNYTLRELQVDFSKYNCPMKNPLQSMRPTVLAHAVRNLTKFKDQKRTVIISKRLKLKAGS